MKLADLYVVIKANTAQLRAALGGVRARLQKVDAAMAKTAATARLTFSVVGAAAAGATYAAVSFEKQMAQVSTMLDDADMMYMKPFTKAIKDMAVEFGQSTATLSQGLYDILSASVPPARALEVLAVASKQAVGGMTETGIAADALTTIMNSYQLSADDAMKVSDMMFGTVKRGKITFEQLASGIGKASATAAAAELSLDELLATIATTTRAGVRPDQAMVAVVGAIRSFLKPTAEAKELANQLGFEMSTATLRTEGFAGVFQRINKLSMEQIAVLFPNIRGLKAVAAAMQDLGGFTKDVELIMNSSGRTMEAYAKHANTGAQNLAKMGQEAIGLARDIGDQLIPVFRELLSSIKNLIRNVKGSAEGIANLIKTIMLGSAAVWAASKAFSALSAVISATVVVFQMLLTPVGALTALLAAGAGAWMYYTKSGREAASTISDAAKTMKEDWKNSWGAMVGAMMRGDLGLAAKIAWTTVKLHIQDIWGDVQVWWAETVEGMRVIWEGLTHALSKMWLNVWYDARKAYAEFHGWFEKQHEKAVGWTTEQMLRTWHALGKMSDEELEFALKGNQDTVNWELNRIKDEKKSKLAAIKEERALANNLAEQQHLENLKRIQAESGAKKKAIEDELAELRKKYRTMVREGLGRPTSIWGILKGVFDTVAVEATSFGDKLTSSAKQGLDKLKGFGQWLFPGRNQLGGATAPGAAEVPRAPMIEGGRSVGLQDVWTRLQQSALGGGSIDQRQLTELGKIRGVNQEANKILKSINKNIKDGGPAMVAGG